MAKIKFHKLTVDEFCDRYPELVDHVFDEDYREGEVKIPGYGWCAAEINDGEPAWFWTEDDGWEAVPMGFEFEQTM